jgi:hypothetical protein
MFDASALGVETAGPAGHVGAPPLRAVADRLRIEDHEIGPPPFGYSSPLLEPDAPRSVLWRVALHLNDGNDSFGRERTANEEDCGT